MIGWSLGSFVLFIRLEKDWAYFYLTLLIKYSEIKVFVASQIENLFNENTQ